MCRTSCFLRMLFRAAPRAATLLRHHKTIFVPVRVALWTSLAWHCATQLSPSGGRQGRHKHFHTHMFQRVLQWRDIKISRARQFVKGLFTFVNSVIISICCSHKELLLALCVFLSLFGCLVHVCSVGRLKYRHLVATYLASP